MSFDVEFALAPDGTVGAQVRQPGLACGILILPPADIFVVADFAMSVGCEGIGVHLVDVMVKVRVG